MNVRLELPPEMEQTLRRRAAAAGQNVAKYVEQAVTEKITGDEEPDVDRKRSSEGFEQWLADLTRLFPVLDHPIDDSRESIYAGCGE